MNSCFLSSVEDGVITLTLNKPEQHNVLNPQEMGELTAFLKTQSEDRSLRVGILTGLGKSFCAGADLGELKDYDFDENPLENLSNQIEAMPFPMICRLNGGVYGGGSDIALACDFRVGMPTTKCFIPPAKIGIHYHASGMARAVARIGLGPAKRLFLAMEKMNGQELKSIGFLDFLVDADELDGKTNELVESMLALAPLSLSGMKATFNDIAMASYNAERAKAAQIQCLKSEDFKEGQAALAEKRPANFKGS